MNLVVFTRISDRTARMFTARLAAHATDEHGCCIQCREPNCAPGREARFELVMAGRLSDPLLG